MIRGLFVTNFHAENERGLNPKVLQRVRSSALLATKIGRSLLMLTLECPRGPKAR